MKKGFTILELLISIALISVVLLLLLRVMMALEVINHDTSYASDDEIARTEIIQNIESDFIRQHLNGLQIEKNNEQIVFYLDMDEDKQLIVSKNSITYDGEVFSIKSVNAQYGLCIDYTYTDLENDYYLINFTIPVYIDGENTTSRDDLIFTYMGLKNEYSSYPNEFVC